LGLRRCFGVFDTHGQVIKLDAIHRWHGAGFYIYFAELNNGTWFIFILNPLSMGIYLAESYTIYINWVHTANSRIDNDVKLCKLPYYKKVDK
jgi:hypothetical protein